MIARRELTYKMIILIVHVSVRIQIQLMGPPTYILGSGEISKLGRVDFFSSNFAPYEVDFSESALNKGPFLAHVDAP